MSLVHLTITYKTVGNKSMPHPHLKGATDESHSRPSALTSLVAEFQRPLRPLCCCSFWNHNCHQPAMVPSKKNLGPSAQKTKPPPGVVPQTDVTVLTLADSACLNLLFRSCMLGDLGLGMREVLRFSGVPPGCCLGLTSLHRTWKAL